MNVELLRKYTDFKNGESVFSKSDRGEVTYLCLYPGTDNHLVIRKGFIFKVPNDDLYQVPLAWKDEKPVYKGDILYYQDSGKEWFGVVLEVNDGMVSFPIVDGVPIDETYWEPAPKHYSADGHLLKWGMNVKVFLDNCIFVRTINSFDKDTVIFQENIHPAFTSVKNVFFHSPVLLEGSPVRVGDVLYQDKERIGKKVERIDEEVYTEKYSILVEDVMVYLSRKPFFWITDKKVPLPEKEAPELNTQVWVPNVVGYPYMFIWNNGSTHKEYLDAGLVHLTEEGANLHRDALLSLSAGLTK